MHQTGRLVVIDYLKQYYGDPLDQDLNPEQKAIAQGFKKMLDENLYWCGVHARWIDKTKWAVIVTAHFH